MVWVGFGGDVKYFGNSKNHLGIWAPPGPRICHLYTAALFVIVSSLFCLLHGVCFNINCIYDLSLPELNVLLLNVQMLD